jgi:hypothetical protein
LLSTLGFLFKNEELLKDLKSEGVAKRLLVCLKEEWGLRARVYTECAQPLFKYGGLLTRYIFVLNYVFSILSKQFLPRLLSHLIGICRSIRDASPASAAPPIKLADVGATGLLLNSLNKQSLKHGHFESPMTPLLPFPDKCCDLVLQDPATLDSTSAAQHEKERQSILDMLASLGVDPAASPAFRMFTNGHIQVIRRILSGDTADLPPTASKTDAVYNPAALYADPV